PSSFAQGGQLPPQSTSVSSPFCTVSAQLGATHSPRPLHTSPAEPQIVPSGVSVIEQLPASQAKTRHSSLVPQSPATRHSAGAPPVPPMPPLPPVAPTPP